MCAVVKVMRMAVKVGGANICRKEENNFLEFQTNCFFLNYYSVLFFSTSLLMSADIL